MREKGNNRNNRNKEGKNAANKWVESGQTTWLGPRRIVQREVAGNKESVRAERQVRKENPAPAPSLLGRQREKTCEEDFSQRSYVPPS